MGLPSAVRGMSMLLALGLMGGCAPADERGSVAVEVRVMPPDLREASYSIRVVGPDDELTFSTQIAAGETTVVGDVPYGWVSVSAMQLCTVETELTPGSPTMRLILDGNHCTLAD